MNPIRIDDPDDPRIAAYRDIRERDLVGRQGRFVAEGKVVLERAVLGPALRGRIGAGARKPARRPGRDAGQGARRPCRSMSRRSAVMDAIAGFHIHRGVLAIGTRRDGASAGANCSPHCPRRALVVALVGISNHDNVGAIFRNAAAFGADAVLLDADLLRSALPQGDPRFGRRGAESSLRHCRTMPTRSSDMLAAHGFEPDSRCRRAARLGHPRRRAGRDRMALYLGTEGEGLPADLLARLKTVRIAMAEGFDSLNVAAASAIALHDRICDARERSVANVYSRRRRAFCSARTRSARLVIFSRGIVDRLAHVGRRRGERLGDRRIRAFERRRQR